MVRFLYFLVTLMLLNSNSFARTWFVGPEGTGAVPSIQEAVDLAASGDTIRIAPGRFNEGRIWETAWTRFIRVMVMVEELTIIGSGPEQTIIGQEMDFNQDQGDHEGIVGISYFGNQILRIENIKFENMWRGIETEFTSELYIKNCVFEGNLWGVWGYSDSIYCNDSQFSLESNGSGGEQAVLNCSTGHVVGCSFSGSSTLGGHRSLYIQGCSDGVVDGCSFNSDRTALYLVGGRTTVQACTFVGQTLAGIYFAGSNNESVQVVDCFFENQYTAIEARGPGQMVCENLEIQSVARSSFYIHNPMNIVKIHNCLLAKGERFVLHPYLGEMKTIAADSVCHFDMQDNWWATGNPDSIQAWIYDANDEPDIGYIVNWSPFLSQPVPNDSETLGGIKSFFR